MAERNRIASEEELNEKLVAALEGIKDALKAIGHLRDATEAVIKADAEEQRWYVLKHEGQHHLVPDRGTHAYCGWQVIPEAEMIEPPPQTEPELFRPIANTFCPGCLRAAQIIDNNRKLREERNKQ